MSSALLLTMVLAAAEPPPAAQETWTVKAGDTCDAIARAVWGDRKHIAELHRWNELGPLPHNLRPGMVLRLRAPTETKAEGPDATLTFLKPAVRTRHLLEWQPAQLGMGLFRLDEVNTLKGAGAALRFRDLSSLLLDENALIVIYGDSAPRKPSEPTGVTLVDGELRLALAQMRAKPLAVNTPAGAVSASGMQGVVAVDGAQTTRVSVFEGTSLVSAKGVTVTVPSNHGTRVRQNQPPEPPRLLPETPALAAVPPVLVAGPDGLASLALSWPAAARAEQYRVQLARDVDFVDRLRDAWTPKLEATLDRLEPGALEVRVIAFDEVGLQSRPSTTAHVEVVELGRGLDAHQELVLTRGSPLTFTLPAALRLSIDGQETTAPPVLTVGVHALRILDASGAVKLETTVVVPPAPPTVVTVGDKLRATFADELDEAIAPVLERDAQQTAFTRVSARVWEVTRPPSGTAIVTWRGRALSRFDSARESSRLQP
ncbi:MAG: FecR domain-containing protein [Myxococcota bacterium]